ncbi:hypothetical protein PsYK624_034970 [Phanerochaete sordida]|uniref:Uncharacterized protein n=1 Tax=Phanerochaete sordida TaxID=48140 RepID=A0A9P3LAD1_9APHY|nr:hypothetical protein PsYK624_034970 [Phanerochaete sordida]
MLVDDVPATPVHPLERPFIVFPPWPDPPAGAKIPVWSDFKPVGIRVSPDEDGIQRDGRGIPTVRLASTHSLTDAEKKKQKGGKKLKKVARDANGRARPLEWYEEWEEYETTRRAIVDPAINRIDRLHIAADEFKACRPWPPPQPEKNPSLIWEIWRHYIGLSARIPSEDNKKLQQDAFDGEDEDEDGDAGDDSINVTVVDAQQAQTNRRPRQPPSQEPDEAAAARREYWREVREGKKEAFLNDPENAVRIFFSSHWRDKGYVRSKEKCKEGPILIGYFLRYLIRSRVFPEEEAALKRAAALCDRAGVELEATWTLSGCLPDKISNGFEQLNGELGNRYSFYYQQPDDAEANPESESAADTSEQQDEQTVQPATEPRTHETEPTVQVIDPDTVDHDAAAMRDAVNDNVDVNGEEPTQPFDMGPQESNPVDDAAWGPPKTRHLFEVLGPTALPYTHTTGIVEYSVRKIEEIIYPPPASAQKAKKKSMTPAEAVEQELTRRLAVVVFTPWVKIGNHLGSDVPPPQLLPDSRGKAVVPVLSRGEARIWAVVNSPLPPAPNDADSPYAAFDPRRDALRVLVHPETAARLAPHVGMGVLAPWVQIARKTQPGHDTRERPQVWQGRRTQDNRGAPGQNGEPTPYWYMESVMLTLTSFHADKYFPGQDEEDD